MDSSLIFLPKHFTLDGIFKAMTMMNFNEAFFNSFVISTLSGVLHVAACTVTAYSLATFNYPFKKLFYIAVIITFSVPPQLLSVPTYSVFKNFDIFGLLRIFLPKGINLLDNPISLLTLYATANALKSGLYIYLLIQFFRSMPRELEEAALVDGAGFIKTFTKIMLPSARLMMVTIFLFTFVWQYTDIFYSSMFFRNFELMSIRLSIIGDTFLRYLMDVLKVPTQPLMVSQVVNAASILFILPILVIYLICNRFFVEGIERSGIVG
jgi:multiple sugar transport system permease protein